MKQNVPGSSELRAFCYRENYDKYLCITKNR